MTATTPAVHNQSRLRSSLDHQLSAFFRERKSVAAAYGSDFERLWIVAGDSVTGGKLVRPFLLIETYDALRPIDPLPQAKPYSAALDSILPSTHTSQRATVVRLAAAIELLHYSFLLHDDVIDGDVMRRGRPNLIGTLLADTQPPANDTPGSTTAGTDDGAAPTTADLHWAHTGAILMGDLLLATTHQVFARADVAHAARLRLLDLLDHTITESVAGEQLDVALGDGRVAPDLTTILSMSAYKTATYSFELPLRAAAILAGADSHLETTLAKAGRHLGLAFQLQDDLLSTFGDSSQHGKDPFSDLREGKQTALIAYARMTSAWPRLETSFGGDHLTFEEGMRMRALLADCGAQQFVQGLVDEQMDGFSDVLDDPASAIPPQVREVLLQLAAQLEGRRS